MSFSISGIPFAPIAYTKPSEFDDFAAFVKDVESNTRYQAFGILKVIFLKNTRDYFNPS